MSRRQQLSLALLSFFMFGVVGCTGTSGLRTSAPSKVDQDLKVVDVDQRQLRQRVLVLPFKEAKVQVPEALKSRAYDGFLLDLNRTGTLVAVPASDFKIDSSTDIKEVINLVKNSGVTAVLEPTLVSLKVRGSSDKVGLFKQMQTEFETQGQVRVIAVRTSKEIFNLLKTVTIEESNVRIGASAIDAGTFETYPDVFANLLKETFIDFVPQVAEALTKTSWEGRIALVQGERFYLNVGKISGVQIGDLLKVTEDGDDVYDPQTGQFVGRSTGRSKGTLEVVSYFGADGAISVLHSGGGFKENDKVELY